MLEPKIKDARQWWSWEDVLLIIFFGAALFLPGLHHIPLFDRDEPRFAEAAREMLRSGNFIVPRFDGVLRPDKPPVIYWLMDFSYRIFGVNGMAARLPSALFAMLTLLVTYWMAGERFGRITGLLSSLILGTAVLFVAESRLATADSVLIFFTTLAMLVAWRAWDYSRISAGHAAGVHLRIATIRPLTAGEFLNQSQPVPARPVSLMMALVFWVSMGLGVLTKGVTPIFVLATMTTLSIAKGGLGKAWQHWKLLPLPAKIVEFPHLILSALRRANWRLWQPLRPIWGIPLMLLVIGPWFVAAWIQTNGLLIQRMLLQNVVQRTTSGLQSHGFPPGFYLLVIWATFWPWSVLLIPAAYHVVRRVRRRGPIAIDPGPYEFLLAWVVPSWIIFELIVTKMVQYVLPLYIPLAILCADMLVQSWHRTTDVLAAKWFATARWIWMTIWLVLAGLTIFAMHYLQPADQHNIFRWSILLAASFAAVGVAGAVSWNRPAWPYVTAFSFMISIILLMTTVLPGIKALQISRQAGHFMAHFERHGYKLAAAGYIEPSLVFYSGGKIELCSGARQLCQVVKFSSQGRTPPVRATKYCVLVDRRILKKLQARHVQFWIQSQYRGIKVAKGRYTRLAVLTNVAPALSGTVGSTTKK